MFQGHENLVHRRQFRGIFPRYPPGERGWMRTYTLTLCMCQVRAPTEQAGVKNDDYSLTSSTQLVTSATGETGNRFAPALIWCANQLNYLVLSATSYCGHPCGWIVSAGSFGTTTRLTPSTLSLPHPHDLVVFFLPSVILVLCPKHINTLFDLYTRSLAIT
jgi:hypothetical protein